MVSRGRQHHIYNFFFGVVRTTSDEQLGDILSFVILYSILFALLIQQLDLRGGLWIIRFTSLFHTWRNLLWYQGVDNITFTISSLEW